MQFWAQRFPTSKAFSTALFHRRPLVESSPPPSSPSSTLWFVKVVSTVFIRRSPSLIETDYFRHDLNPFIAYTVVHHINTRLNNPDSAFSFFSISRLRLNLVHLEPTFDLLLRSLCQIGRHDSAEIVYNYMKSDGFLPDTSVSDFLVWSFSNAGKFRIAEEILIARAEFCNERDELVNSFVYNNFLSMLMNRNRIDEAVLFFSHILRLKGFSPDTRNFNIVMRGLCRVSKTDKAFEFFDVMKSFGCHPDLVTYNTLINGLCRVGKVDRAEELLREIKVESNFSADVVTYTSVISGYCKLGKTDAAASLFEQMISNGIKPNLFTYNSIIDGFGKKGEVSLAKKMYERMLADGFRPDVVTFTSLIDCYCRCGDLGQGINLLGEMNEKKVSPNVFTFSVLISALCKENRLNEARDLLNQLKWREDIVPPPFVYNPVIDGYCKSGNVDEANKIVAEMEAKGCVHDKMTFTILILGHCMKGRMIEAIGVYNKMLSVGCVPDNIAVSSLISCLRKAGMAREANEIEQKALFSVQSGSLSKRTNSVRNNMNVTAAV